MLQQLHVFLTWSSWNWSTDLQSKVQVTWYKEYRALTKATENAFLTGVTKNNKWE